jgi:ABC-type histidine transport system ATPase subunit
MTSQVFRRSDRYVEVAPESGYQPSGRGGRSVTIERLRKSFGQNQVLRGIDLQISAGEFVAVVGRSGSARARCCVCWSGLTDRAKVRFASAMASNRRHKLGQ